MDCNLLRDIDDDHPGTYLTSFVRSSTFPQSVWFSSTDNASFAEFYSQGTQPVIGICEDAYNRTVWEDWDDTTTMSVTMLNGGSLSSTTKAAIVADPTINAFAYGRPGNWEFFNAATCTLASSSPHVIYELSNLLSGRRGTNTFVNTHLEKEHVIKLEASGNVFRHVQQNSQIGNDNFYKVIKVGDSISDSSSYSYTNTGAPLKPYSPIQMSVVDSSGDLVIDATRRTRKGGSLGGDNTLTDGVGGPLNEDSEEYEIDYVNSTTEAKMGEASTTSLPF